MKRSETQLVNDSLHDALLFRMIHRTTVILAGETNNIFLHRPPHRLRNRLPSQSSTSSDGKHKKSTASNAPVSASSASASTATATTKLRNSDHEIKDIQYKLIKLKAHGLDTDSNTDVTSGSKDYEEKYSNQLQITEAYQVEYDENNLQGALIVNSQGIDTKLIDNAQSKPRAQHILYVHRNVALHSALLFNFLPISMEQQNKTTKSNIVCSSDHNRSIAIGRQYIHHKFH